MSKDKEQCALCDLPVEVTGFSLQTVNGEKYFCCEGCVCAYRMFNDDYLSDKDNTQENQPE